MIHNSLAGLDEAGICIVGAGPAGLALAMELERRGIPVLILESGTERPDAGIQALSDAEFVDASRHDDMRIAVSRQLGGTSNLWGARCLKYDAVDFDDRPGLVDAKWPLAYEELLPFYARACALTASGAPVYESAIPGLTETDGTFTCDTLERWATVQQAQLIHGETLARSPLIDVRLQTTVVDIGLDEGGRVRDVELARSDGSERRRIGVGALALATGGLESTRLLLALQRKHPALFGGTDGPLGRYYMGHVIGEIADIVFARDELKTGFDFFVDEFGSYVRRRLVPSRETQLREQILNVALWPIVPPISDPRHRTAILSLVYLALAFGPVGRRITAEAIRIRHVPPKLRRPVAHLVNIVGGVPEAVAFASDFLRKRRGKYRLPGLFIHNEAGRYGLAFHSEQAPNPESRVTLAEGSDRLGLPKLRIDLRFQAKDADSVVRTHDLLETWLQANAFGHLEYRVRREERAASVMAQARHGTHQIGTARMAASPADGVTDRDLRAFGVDNLFVASSAVLPTSSQANPTLTVVALCVRLAKMLSKDFEGAVRAG